MAKQLGIFGAVLRSFFGRDIGYFPRRKGEQSDVRITPEQLVVALQGATAGIAFEKMEDAKHVVDQVKASFTEVKQATEYQDQKIARLLTVMAFLTAAAAALFSKFVDGYPLQGWVGTPAWTFLAHALFGTYLMLVSLGALVGFHAMQTRFLTTGDSGDKLASLLFFKHIASTDAEVWGRHFSANPSKLMADYAKHYILETYLIAAKTSDKVRFLEPAQRLMEWAIRVLILWLLSIGIVVSLIPARQSSKTPTISGTQQTTPAVQAEVTDSSAGAGRPAVGVHPATVTNKGPASVTK